MVQKSAGILLFRPRDGACEVFLVHPGGPFFARKDDGAWSIPKGLFGPGEDPAAAARREFTEETGFAAPTVLIPLGAFRQPGGKIVIAYAAEGDADPARLRSNVFSLEWPPRSGRTGEFPEVDRGAWFGFDAAKAKLTRGQQPILAALVERLAAGGPGEPADP